jgi:hypothetical protein
VSGATTVVTSTKEFLVKTDIAAIELFNQVDKIDKAVSVAVASATPDLSQVKITANGLGSSIGGIVAKAVSNANISKTALSAAVTPQAAGPESDYDRVKNPLIDHQNATNQAMRRVKALLPPNFDSLNTSALASCGVAPTPSPFVANPDKIDFKAQKAQSSDVNLSGGTKEYVVDMETVPKGLKVTPPGKDGSVLKVSLDAAADVAPDQYEMRLHDQTPAGNGVLIKITILPADKQPPADGTAPAAGGTKAGTSAAAAKNKSTGQKPAVTAAVKETDVVMGVGSVTVGGKTFPISGADDKTADKSIMVSFCGPYLDSDKAAVLDALTSKLKGKVKAKLNAQRGAACIGA